MRFTSWFEYADDPNEQVAWKLQVGDMVWHVQHFTKNGMVRVVDQNGYKDLVDGSFLARVLRDTDFIRNRKVRAA